ncbi:zinc ribbon domain-containing protein [uncultured Methanobrevibacter sp.]|uniref:zinc ribbon domain-containing protein n=1 Tax=uncultured Methanobrevibacter sp. TaxID=253161 RepID=UPI0025E5C880|nr:zinc ribbon domain-containing protein [uncultured Methanobrevibacter sp.]
MENYCKNCGADIKDNAQFCQECGTKVENISKLCSKCGEKLDDDSEFCQKCGTKLKNTCPNCGANTEESENFCENCGHDLNTQKIVKNENLIEKYKIPIIITLIIIISIIGIQIVPSIMDYAIGTQIVYVDEFNYKIPANFNSTTEKLVKSDDPGVSNRWSNGNEYIEIWVLPPKHEEDSADSIISNVGGGIHNKYGYTGYYNKFTDGGEAFSYSRNNKAITIFVSDEKLFDKIEVL